jgi:RNA polymerase sigma factor (sigma-70 family)
MDEQELLNKCLKDDKTALTELYQRFSSKMYVICLRYAKNRFDAQDLLHDGFIKVIESLKEYRNEGSLEGWLKRIMVNCAINFYNRKNAIGFESIDQTFEDIAFEEDAISELSAKQLLEIIEEIPEGYRIIFNLYVIDGYKHNEIANYLNISENTSKSQLMKARIMIMKRLKQKYYDKENKSIDKHNCKTI